MMEFGYGMAGMEKRFLELASNVADNFDEVTYVEIGVGEGPTLTAIARTLADSGKRWRAIGIDLPNGYSLNRDKANEFAAQRGLTLEWVTPNGNIQRPKWNQVTVYLRDSQSFLTELWQDSIQMAMVDGCHGKPCVILDFVAVEAWAVDGATVLLHDFGADQIGHFQPHCPTGLDVRGAARELGLIGDFKKRPGWTFVEEWTADAARGGWGMGIFKKEKQNV